MRASTSARARVAEPRRQRGLIDMSVVIDLGRVDAADLPSEIAVSAVTLAELAAGPHATNDPDERARRQDRLQRTEATFEALPLDGAVSRAYGRVYAVVAGAGAQGEGPARLRPPHRGHRAGSRPPALHLQAGGLPGARQPSRRGPGSDAIAAGPELTHFTYGV
jgi:predicted nucleic acid-binding protein